MARDIGKSVLTMLVLGFFLLIIAKQIWVGAPDYINVGGFQPNIIIKYVVAFVFVYAGYFVWNRFIVSGSMSMKDFYALAIAAAVLLFIYMKVLPNLGILDSAAVYIQSMLGIS